jgi:EAL domain-containing protein (putative c-di-GMP-specific phosphodiesterase class I)
MSTTFATKSVVWTLTEFGQGDHQQRKIDLPFRTLMVGRGDDADVRITHGGVSKRHARIQFKDDLMLIEDLGSTNGTHLNGNKIEFSIVQVGDLLQFGNALYRVGRRGDSIADGTIEEGIVPWAQTLLLFDRLLTERAVVPHFQPIVTMRDRTAEAYELLARSKFEGLSSPALMFGAAERLGQQAALSEMMRSEGISIVGNSTARIFLNTHPSEVVTERLVESLRELRADNRSAQITVEIHEGAVTDPGSIRGLRCVLSDLDMQLSYDDFGAGQGRLLELGEVPPDTLKFDMQLIRNIDTAASSRQELLGSLVRISLELGAVPLAEGVETEGEHEVCLQMGFQLGQGFLYGRPAIWGAAAN